jgi:L-aminopeptidase/D-esterase-like protein
MNTQNDTLTLIPGILVGHAQDDNALTGCTVIICEKGAVGGVDQRGGAPGTRETDLLRPMHMVTKVHAVVLTGGSAFGLDSSGGVMKFLEEKKIGVNTGVARVPIVVSAVIFDLAVGNPAIRPDAAMGYQACLDASASEVIQGNSGAGIGASVGKILGPQNAMKAGLGTAVQDIGGGVLVGALMVVNAFGDVVDPSTGKIIAGARTISKGPIKIGDSEVFADTLKTMPSFAGRSILKFASANNTVIGVVATNARLTKEEANKVAQMAQDGLARVVRPAHTMFDGDTLFAMATGQKPADVNIVGAYAAEVVAAAIVNAVKNAKPLGGLPAYLPG